MYSSHHEIQVLVRFTVFKEHLYQFSYCPVSTFLIVCISVMYLHLNVFVQHVIITITSTVNKINHFYHLLLEGMQFGHLESLFDDGLCAVEHIIHFSTSTKTHVKCRHICYHALAQESSSRPIKEE